MSRADDVRMERDQAKIDLAHKCDRLRMLTARGADHRIRTRYRLEILALTDRINCLNIELNDYEELPPIEGN